MRVLVPEVVQTSAMDCGPAALRALLVGHGIPASYGRLREACQTSVDGTSIDTLEEVANQLGLDAEQVMIPADHLPLDEAGALPALVVVRQPTGLTHFVVAWRRHAGWLQLMDPAVGRRWVRWPALRDELFLHVAPVPAAGWRAWAAGDEFLRPLARRLRDLGADEATTTRLVREAAAAEGWRPLAALDAATRMTASLVESRGVRRGRGAGTLAAELAVRAAADDAAIPSAFWSARAAPAEPGDEEEEQLWMRGAVLLRVRGVRPAGASGEIAPELAAALAEPEPRPLREVARLLRGDAPGARATLLGGAAVGAGAVVLEALLFRGAMEVGARLGLVQQRLTAAGLVAVFLLAVLALELGVGRELARLGRRLEVRLRVAFHAKLPRVADRYFASRPVSDMAERSHAIHALRVLPRWGGQLLRATVQLAATVAAVAWLFPRAALPALLAGLAALLIPLLFLPAQAEQDLRLRTHGGALARFQLDALLGLLPIRSHAAEPAVLREQEGLLTEWAHAAGARLRTAAAAELAQGVVGTALALWAFLRAAGGGADGGLLLLAFWALSIPALGGEIALLLRQLPTFRSLALRLLEPLAAPEEQMPESGGAAAPAGAASVRLEGVSVRAAGHRILHEVDLSIAPAEHLAVVGASGAGKSSLVGLLLGVHRPEEGRLLVDGATLDGDRLARLRERTAWVDPAVQLWNRSLLDNLTYGAPDGAGDSLAGVLDGADLLAVLHDLPEGLQGGLGEGGGLLSGGEGQRVRLGRALLRQDARLVVLDEPFRGLDGERRAALLGRARNHWRGATLVCVTHDIEDTLHFPRVVVIDEGRVAADGEPREMARDAASPFGRLLHAERAARAEVWGHPDWRRERLDDGRLVAG